MTVMMPPPAMPMMMVVAHLDHHLRPSRRNHGGEKRKCENS
jgi:hypothetical protein